MNRPRAWAGLLCVLLVAAPVGTATAQQRPQGEMRWALYVTLAPIWFDPGEIGGLTAFWVLYGIHDGPARRGQAESQVTTGKGRLP